MAYSNEISRQQPTAFLFLLDQSTSMGDRHGSSTKAQTLADTLNRTLSNLIIRCSKAEGTRDYFEVGVLGYSSGVQDCLNLSPSILAPISLIHDHPKRVETRMKKVSDGAGGILETKIHFPVWYDSSSGGSTNMTQALQTAREVLSAWIQNHPNSNPPTVLHITDGESTDGDPTEAGLQLQSLRTSDGAVLLFNLHLDPSSRQTITFPGSGFRAPTPYAQMLFDISSPLPPHIRDQMDFSDPDPRGFIYNSTAELLAEFFDIGTRALTPAAPR